MRLRQYAYSNNILGEKSVLSEEELEAIEGDGLYFPELSHT